jgi:hypothetical protein
MEKEFVPYQQALELKELGFNEPCFDFYDNNQELFYNHENKEKIHVGGGLNAPLYQQAFRWFREKHKLHSIFEHDSDNYYYVIQGVNDIDFNTIDADEDSIVYQTYEEAELECLKKLIEIVKNK